MKAKTKKFNLYPIQAKYIGILELHLKANQVPDNTVSIEGESHRISVGHSEYDAENKTLEVFIKLEAGHRPKKTEPPNSPFFLQIQMLGVFHVNEEKFNIERIYEWAGKNAIYIFYPYLRENVYSLTSKSGFKPMILPLVEIPTMRIEHKAE
jgi:preprotein translocase subunit SecB